MFEFEKQSLSLPTAFKVTGSPSSASSILKLSEIGYKHFGFLMDLGDRVLAIYRTGSGHISNDGKIAMRVSFDGTTFGPEVNIAVGSAPNLTCRPGGCIYNSAGRLILIYSIYENENSSGAGYFKSIGYIYSDDKGQTWSGYTILIDNTGNEYNVILAYGKGVTFENHSVITFYLHKKSGQLPLALKVFRFSNDLAVSQHFIQEWNSLVDYNEAAIVSPGGSSLICISRVGGGSKFVQFKSDDQGITWYNQGVTNTENQELVAPSLDIVNIDDEAYLLLYYFNRDTLKLMRRTIPAKNALSSTAWGDAIEIMDSSGYNNLSGYQTSIVRGPRILILVFFEKSGGGDTDMLLKTDYAGIENDHGIIEFIVSQLSLTVYIDPVSGNDARTGTTDNNDTVTGRIKSLDRAIRLYSGKLNYLKLVLSPGEIALNQELKLDIPTIKFDILSGSTLKFLKKDLLVSSTKIGEGTNRLTLISKSVFFEVFDGGKIETESHIGFIGPGSRDVYDANQGGIVLLGPYISGNSEFTSINLIRNYGSIINVGDNTILIQNGLTTAKVRLNSLSYLRSFGSGAVNLGTNAQSSINFVGDRVVVRRLLALSNIDDVSDNEEFMFDTEVYHRYASSIRTNAYEFVYNSPGTYIINRPYDFIFKQVWKGGGVSIPSSPPTGNICIKNTDYILTLTGSGQVVVSIAKSFSI